MRRVKSGLWLQAIGILVLGAATLPVRAGVPPTGPAARSATPEGMSLRGVPARSFRRPAGRTTQQSAPGPAPVSFLNDVIPVLTRAGCNAGACHGAAAGKNG